MASAAQAHRDLSLLIPTPVGKPAVQQMPRPNEFENSKEQVEELIGSTINRMVELANKHGAELPFIDISRMTVSQPREGVLFVQSGGHIFVFNAGKDTLSVDGKSVLG